MERHRAFALVVTLDMTRREYDRKVLAVKVQMQDLMTAFFELRQIPDSEVKGPDSVTIAARLEGLMQTIANDIKLCGSVCDTYLKKDFLGEFPISKANSYARIYCAAQLRP
ncbi:hypothetical protein BDZ94DRAFT_1316358 [Collybia nuda]|uniref:Uncharacterized protein n=1 Tax=Collybia nuda TaxID=64659 RepID=A0A9P5XPR5_9AGAR|nr:hypothetical protein BDZ94DRAFT_1316358 [Collybia nuda]